MLFEPLPALDSDESLAAAPQNCSLEGVTTRTPPSAEIPDMPNIISRPSGGRFVINTSSWARTPVGACAATLPTPQHVNGSPLKVRTIVLRGRYVLQQRRYAMLSVLPVSINTARSRPSTWSRAIGRAPQITDRETTPALTRRPHVRFPNF